MGYASVSMANRAWFNRVDLWVQRFLSPASTRIAESSALNPIRSQKLLSFSIGFLGASAISLILLRVHRGELVPIVTLVCIAIAANAAVGRRKYYLLGILALIPIQIIVALARSLFWP
jgi:hypothetical protein